MSAEVPGHDQLSLRGKDRLNQIANRYKVSSAAARRRVALTPFEHVRALGPARTFARNVRDLGSRHQHHENESLLGKFSDLTHRNHPGALAFTGAESGPGSASAFACTSKSGAARPGAYSRTAVAHAAESCAYANAGTHTEPPADVMDVLSGDQLGRRRRAPSDR
jgi:hypothetical protein